MNDKPILSISSNGKRREIKLNTPPGTSITTNAANAVMKNVEQKTTGGAIEHNTHDLTQIGGSQTAKNEGKITNRVEGGTLLQKNVIQSADNAGEILNEVKKKLVVPIIISVIAIIADLSSLFFTGEHIWELLT